MSDAPDIARQIAHRRADDVYCTIWKAIYLHEINEREGLSNVALATLVEARREIAVAVGIVRE